MQVLRRKNVVARLVPAEPKRAPTVDFLARAKAVWQADTGTPLSQVLDEDRGDR